MDEAIRYGHLGHSRPGLTSQRGARVASSSRMSERQIRRLRMAILVLLLVVVFAAFAAPAVVIQYNQAARHPNRAGGGVHRRSGEHRADAAALNEIADQLGIPHQFIVPRNPPSATDSGSSRGGDCSSSRHGSGRELGDDRLHLARDLLEEREDRDLRGRRPLREGRERLPPRQRGTGQDPRRPGQDSVVGGGGRDVLKGGGGPDKLVRRRRSWGRADRRRG